MSIPQRTATPQKPSPLDAFLRRFLRAVAAQERGFSPIGDAATTAAEMGCEPAFVDALFTSARARGLIEPLWGRGVRARNRWRLSARGDQWIADQSVSDAETPETAEPIR